MNDVPKKVKAGGPRVDRDNEDAGIEAEIDQQIGETEVKDASDIPWDFGVA
jgi:hypothetical protein